MDGPILAQRSSGILLHITSLPSPFGIGDLGPNAYRFADFLASSKQRIWQILPLTPIDPTLGNSPYNSSSAFAGNKYLISPEILQKEGLVSEIDLEPIPTFPSTKVEYQRAIEFKDGILAKAFERFNENEHNEHEKYNAFNKKNEYWLDDFILFTSIKSYFGGILWSRWPKGLRDRDPVAIDELRAELKNDIDKERFYQYLFFEQWYALKRYCNDQDIRIIGDIPIYVDYNSSDVWAKPFLFKLDGNKKPIYVAGVPPDYFSKTGQRWGNPVYNWEAHRTDGYAWWLKRFEHNLNMYDSVRIDHFRGLAQFWEVPAAEKTALNGHWSDGPGEDLFYAIQRLFPSLPIIAEDLGIITDDVVELKEKFSLPGLKVLLFAFNSEQDDSPYLPHMHERNCIVYTGTHDNNTVKGWVENDATELEIERLSSYIGEEKIDLEDINWKLITLAMESQANIAVIPMQDLLGLDRHSRMNTPSKRSGNWEWRLSENDLTPQLMEKLKDITNRHGRANA